MTGCCSSKCPRGCPRDSLEIPCEWHTPLERGLSSDRVPILWWEALDDCQLTDLIEQAAFRNVDVRLAMSKCRGGSAETVNTITAETAKTYLELRGLQARLRSVKEGIEVQSKIGSLQEGLSESHISSIDLNETRKAFYALLLQENQIELSIKKVMFHLSTLLNYAPGELCEVLYQPCEPPKVPCYIPIGLPSELIDRHPSVRDAKKLYLSTCSEQAFYNYQKKILNVLEEAEGALAAFFSSFENMLYLEHSTQLKKESYTLINDLYTRGLKDEREALAAYQEFLTQEIAFNVGKSELLINYVNLYKALSSGYEVVCRCN